MSHSTQCPNCHEMQAVSAYFNGDGRIISRVVCLACGAFRDKDGVWYRPVEQQGKDYATFEPLSVGHESTEKVNDVGS